MPTAHALVIERPAGAELEVLVGEPIAALAVDPVPLPAVPVAIERPWACVKEEVEDDGFGHGFLYTNCSGLLQRAQSSPLPLVFPSAKAIQCRLRDTVQERHQCVLKKLPTEAKLYIALECWISPFQEAFMAISGYFIDDKWKYRELLLGFEPLHGSHTGVNIGTVLFEVLQRYQLVERVLTVTTDSASNNQTLVGRMHEQLESLKSRTTTPIVQVPCIAHVIQLILKGLLGYMKLEPVNEATQREWSENQSQSLRASQRKGIISTLSKTRIKISRTVCH